MIVVRVKLTFLEVIFVDIFMYNYTDKTEW